MPFQDDWSQKVHRNPCVWNNSSGFISKHLCQECRLKIQRRKGLYKNRLRSNLCSLKSDVSHIVASLFKEKFLTNELNTFDEHLLKAQMHQLLTRQLKRVNNTFTLLSIMNFNIEFSHEVMVHRYLLAISHLILYLLAPLILRGGSLVSIIIRKFFKPATVW